jgi:peptidyl-prolyl cis-trans isomerase D
MLTELRKVTRGWVALGVIGLLALAFAIWGINDVFKPIQSNEVASGRNLSLGQNEFNVAFENELKTVQQQAGRPVSKQEAVAANFHMQVVDRLVTQRAFDRLARRVGVDASDAMVRKEIESTPAFRNEITGAFDAIAYQQLLAQNRLSRSMYEEDLRAGMTREQLARALAAGLRPPTSFGRIVLAFETERRTVSIAAISPDRVPAPPAPTDAELQTFYTAQSAAFALPEFRAFTVVRAEPADFEARVEVAEDKIREMFEFRKATLTTPERRSFVVVTGGDRAKGEEAARRLAAGEDANTIARTLGMQTLMFNQKPQTEAPDARLGAAVFQTAAGRATGAIEGLTWSAARVTEIVPGVAPTLEEARPAIHAELARDEAETLMNDAVEKFEEARAGGADLEAAARQAGLSVSKTPLVEARGLGQNGQPDPSVLDKPDLLKTVFDAAEGDPTDWVSETGGASYLVRIDQLKPTGPPPLAQVRDRVAEAWRLQKIGQGMAKIVDDTTAAVRGGASFADAARTQRLQTVATSQVLDRRNAQQTASQQLAQAIFAAREGDVVSGIGGPRNQIMFVARVEKIERDDPSADPQGVQQRRQAMSEALVNDTLATIQAAARADARVKLNQPLIDRLVGKADPADDAN